MKVVGFVDAYLVGCTYDRKSTTWFIFILAGGVISWKGSKHSSLLASSTMEVELIACYKVIAHAKCLKIFVSKG